MTIFNESQRSLVPKPLSPSGQLVAKFATTQPKVIVHMTNPEIAVIDSVFSKQECDALVDLMQARLKPSYVFDNNTGVSTLDKARTSQGAFFYRGENSTIDALDERLAYLCNWPLSHSEQMQFLQYGPNEFYVPHYDFFHLDQPGSKETLVHAGNRVATVIVYLHEPEEGGSTFFPDLNLQVNPVRGSAVFFSYDRPSPDTKTLHSGEPVIRGTKCIATKWFRERAFQSSI